MRSRPLAALFLAATVALPAAASAQSTKPIQLSLFDPVQIYDRDTSIKGFRLSLLYGRNADFTGLDLSLVGRTDGAFRGVQFGAAGLANDFKGWQSNYFVNFSEGYFEGFQSSPVNIAEGFRGFQWGMVNVSQEMSGFQLGFINVTDQLNGLQIGVLNVATGKASFRVLPIVNWSF
jgi:hypothetical protein